VRAAAEALSSVKGSGDDAAIAEVVDALRRAMGEFDVAERALLDTLVRERGK
jgi:hypothetical protein